MITVEMDNRKQQDHRQEFIRGAQEAIDRDQARLDYHAKTGYYTEEDVAMSKKAIEYYTDRIRQLKAYSEDELLAEISR